MSIFLKTTSAFSSLSIQSSQQRREENNGLPKDCDNPASKVLEVNELLFQILQHVPFTDLSKVALTCRRWARVVREPIFNQYRLALDFPFSPGSSKDPIATYHSKVKTHLAIRSPTSTETRDLLRFIPVSDKAVKMLISSDGLVIGSSGANVSNGQHVPLANHNFILSVPSSSSLYSHEDSLLSGHSDGRVLFWEKDLGMSRWTQTGLFRPGVHSITSLLADGDSIFAADAIGRIHVFSCSLGKFVSDYAHLTEVRSLQKKGDALISAGKDGAIYEWETSLDGLKKRGEICSLGVPVTCMHLFHDMLIAAREDGTLAIFQKVENCLWVKKDVLQKGSSSIRALSSHENFIFSANDKGEITVWEFLRGRWSSFNLSRKISSAKDPVISLHYEHDKNQLHCGSSSGNVYVYDFSKPSSLAILV